MKLDGSRLFLQVCKIPMIPYYLKDLLMVLFKRSLIFLFVMILLCACEQNLQQPVYEYTLNNSAQSGSRFPNLYKDDSGNITMSWMLNIEEEMFAIQYASYNNGRWTAPATVDIGSSYFVNWADFPSVVSMNEEIVAAHWLKKIEGGPYAYDVQITFPGDQPRRWTEPVSPHSDGTATEHGFVSLEPLSEEKVLAIWLDGRNTEGRNHGDYDNMDMAMSLRSAEVSDSGEVTRKNVIDSRVCDCCQTDLAKLDDGYVAVYRDREEGEIRDISIARYSDNTGEWSEPALVHFDGWEINACPVNGPRVAANGNRVAVAWYTMAQNEPRVLLAISDDGGESFADPVQIAGEYSIGRVDVAMADDGKIYVSWMEQGDERGYIMMRALNESEGLEEPKLVGFTSASRGSGFPRMALTDQGTLIAWTQTEPIYKVRTALVPFQEEPESE